MCCSYTSAARPLEVIGSGLQTTHLVPVYPEDHLSPGNMIAQRSSMLLLLISSAALGYDHGTPLRRVLRIGIPF